MRPVSSYQYMPELSNWRPVDSRPYIWFCKPSTLPANDQESNMHFMTCNVLITTLSHCLVAIETEDINVQAQSLVYISLNDISLHAVT